MKTVYMVQRWQAGYPNIVEGIYSTKARAESGKFLLDTDKARNVEYVIVDIEVDKLRY
jgi:hypothetical protein